MYHNQTNMIELHDDVVGVEKSELKVQDGHPVRLVVTFILRPDRAYDANPVSDVRLHSTNGVSHRYSPLNSPDPLLADYQEMDNAQPLLNGQNEHVMHDADGRPMFVTPANEASNAPAGAGYTSHAYKDNLAYVSSDFDDGLSLAERDMRHQQTLVDKTTAKRRTDKSTTMTANSLTAKEAEEEDEKSSKKGADEKHTKHENLRDGDSVRLEHDKKDK